MFLTSTNRKHGTMELLLFMPGFSSPAIPLSVSLSVPLSCCLSPYSERKGGGQVSPLAKLRSTPECEIKWNPISTNKLWMDLGVSLMSCLPACTITALLLFLHIVSVIPYYCLFISYIHEYLTHARQVNSVLLWAMCVVQFTCETNEILLLDFHASNTNALKRN